MSPVYAENYTDITPIRSLWKEWTFLDPNAAPPSIEFEGKVYPTLTHALNASKTSNLGEREDLLTRHAFWVSGWGEHRPYVDDPYRGEWEEEVRDITLILTAQKFGLVTVNDPKAIGDNKIRYKYAFWLTLTQGKIIRYENSHCDTYWGICYCSKHYDKSPKSIAPGENELGKATMIIRSKLIRDLRTRSFMSGTCDWCYEYKNQLVTPAHEYVIYFRDGKLTVRSYCRKHYKAETHDARKFGDGEFFTYSIEDLPSEVSLAPIQTTSRIIIPSRRRGAWEPPHSHVPTTSNSNRSRSSQMGFHQGWSPRTPPRTAAGCGSSCWNDKDSKDVFGVMIIKSDGTVDNHVTAAV